MERIIDVTGQTFGRWTVLRRAENTVKGQAQWWCRCACGTEKCVSSIALRHGISRSCGCLKREVTTQRSTKHGHAPSTGVSPTYHSWAGMIARCTDTEHRSYPEYGAAGVTVCERWRTFANFLADMGEKPPGKSLDRHPHPQGNYEPENCRWATPGQQSRNKSNNRMITFRDETLCLQEWADRLGISPSTLAERLDKWSLEKALTQTKTPAHQVNVSHTLTWKNETHSLMEWARRLGSSWSTIYYRYHKNLSVEDILKTT